MNNTNVLFVSVAFPPKFDSESLQTERVFRELLTRKGYKFGVVTANPAHIRNMPVSATMTDFSNQIDDYIELTVYENKWLNRTLAIFGLSQLPDTKRAFHRSPLEAFDNLSHQPDVIYSRSFPPSSAILAYRLSVHFDVPWVMHLSDPWTLSPILHYSKIELSYNQAWERLCLERARFISFTTERTLDLYAAHYAELANKFFITRNSVEINDSMRETGTVSATELRDDKLRIVHTGLLNRHRNPAMMLKALETVRHEWPEVFARIKLIFAGPCDRHVARIFAEHHNLVSYVGTVTYDESRKMIAEADLVLSVDIDFPNDSSAVFLPSKLLDYGAAGKKIICITNKGSPSADFVTKSGGAVFEHGEWKQLVSFLLAMAGAKAAGEVTAFKIEPLPGCFMTPFVVDRILEKIDVARNYLELTVNNP
jgi:glycosyltransferase involved in cell wall biosynthesis